MKKSAVMLTATLTVVFLLPSSVLGKGPRTVKEYEEAVRKAVYSKTRIHPEVKLVEESPGIYSLFAKINEAGLTFDDFYEGVIANVRPLCFKRRNSLGIQVRHIYFVFQNNLLFLTRKALLRADQIISSHKGRKIEDIPLPDKAELFNLEEYLFPPDLNLAMYWDPATKTAVEAIQNAYTKEKIPSVAYAYKENDPPTYIFCITLLTDPWSSIEQAFKFLAPGAVTTAVLRRDRKLQISDLLLFDGVHLIWLSETSLRKIEATIGSKGTTDKGWFHRRLRHRLCRQVLPILRDYARVIF